VRRRLFNLAAAVSMVMCASIIFCWMLSYSGDHRQSVALPDSTVYSVRGSIIWEQPQHLNPDPPRPEYDFSFVGFSVSASGEPSDAWTYWRTWTAPYWFFALATLTLPVKWLFGSNRRQKAPRTCARCGYDLRATPDRCPECGTAVAMSSSRKLV
jgi:hypothetical protein